MKTKIYILLAALLLNVCAFAQSENTTPLKGDVNNDGTVDVADINAVIEIMKNGGGTGEETKYYWYAGTTKPMSLSQATVVDSYKSEYTYTNNSGAKSHIFVLTDNDHTVTFINLATNNPVSQLAVDATTIPGYKIFETAVGTANTGSIKIRVDAAAAPTYYWYVGTTKPTSLSQASTVTSYPAQQTYTNPSTTEKCYVYVLTNSNKTVNFYDPSDLSTPATTTEDTTTISGYKITNMNVKLAKGGTIVIKIS